MGGVMLTIRLQWVRYPDGFIIVRDRPAPQHLHLMNREPMPWLMPRNPDRSEIYIAEGTRRRIFIDLANVARAKCWDEIEQNVLFFTNKWGPLNNDLFLTYIEAVSKRSAERQSAAADLQQRVDELTLYLGAMKPPIIKEVWGAATNLSRAVDASKTSKSLAYCSAQSFLDDPPQEWEWRQGFMEPRDLLRFCYAEFLQVVEGQS